MNKKESIWFLRQLVQDKQRQVGEVLNFDLLASKFVNEKNYESAKAHQQSCAEVLNFLMSLEEQK